MSGSASATPRTGSATWVFFAGRATSRSIAVLSALLVYATGTVSAASAPLQDPPVFASQNGALSVLMVAAKRPSVPISTPSGTVTTDLWTYEVCALPAPGANACPIGASWSGLGGVRLQLQPGDWLKVRLVNQLPTAPDADHIADDPYLINNPTNLHTHGLIVEPHRAAGPSDTYGDYVFVEVTNPANQAVPPGVAAVTPVHPGIDLAAGAAEYAYHIDATHPPGLFWFHPHLHGVSLNQVTAGLAGIITVGSVADECADGACVSAVSQSTVHQLVLKDTQVGSGGVLMSQPDPDFCQQAPASPRQGTCPGQGDFAGGVWVHTVNGQVYPHINVGASGDVWQILNASGSRSYQLSLNRSTNGKALPLQILAIDGITLGTKSGASRAAIAGLLNGKVRPMPCPGQGSSAQAQDQPGDDVTGNASAQADLTGSQDSNGSYAAICADVVRMMPSSRIEVRVLRTDNGAQDQAATLRTAQYDTGDGMLGDHWPAIDLASVVLSSRNRSAPTWLPLKSTAQTLSSLASQLIGPATLQVPGTTTVVPASSAETTVTPPSTSPAIQPALVQAASAAITPQIAVGQVADPKCRPLASGHRRKIIFGYPTATTFGLGYVEVDEHGSDIEATRIPIREFDPTQETVCVPTSANGGVEEVWELINATSEDHNFHIHQTRFYLLAGGAASGTAIPGSIDKVPVWLDNVPLPRPSPAAAAAACDGTLAAVQSGACKPTSTFVVIPFREVGDFVFHCHILEHEDGGMMARIRVVLKPAT